MRASFTPNQFRPLQVLSENHALINCTLIFSFVIYYYRKELTSLKFNEKEIISPDKASDKRD